MIVLSETVAQNDEAGAIELPCVQNNCQDERNVGQSLHFLFYTFLKARSPFLAYPVTIHK
jgi:hypothetical protein